MAGLNVIFPECIICLNPMQNNLITPINCGHIFHEECFHDWKIKSNEDICPLCKRDSSNILKLIYEIKFNQDEINQEPQTLTQLLQRNNTLKYKCETLEKEVEELKEYNAKCQSIVEGFKISVEENNKNMQKYKSDYLDIKVKLDEEKDKNEQYSKKIEELEEKIENLQNFKNKFDIKLKIDEETEKILLNKDAEKVQDEFEKQFYKLLNDDDEKKGLHEYFYVLQEKISKLTTENEELVKFKKNALAKEKMNNNNTNFSYTQLFQMANNKRNYNELKGKNELNSDNNKIINQMNHIENCKKKINNKPNNKKKKKEVIMKKIFDNPFKKKELIHKNK